MLFGRQRSWKAGLKHVLVALCRDWRLIEVDSSLAHVEAHQRRMMQLLMPADTVIVAVLVQLIKSSPL